MSHAVLPEVGKSVVARSSEPRCMNRVSVSVSAVIVEISKGGWAENSRSRSCAKDFDLGQQARSCPILSSNNSFLAIIPEARTPTTAYGRFYRRS